MDGGVQRHREQEASTGVVVDPREDDRERHHPEHEHAKAAQVAGEAGAKADRILVRAGNKEEGQMPYASERSEEECCHGWTRPPLQARRCETPPAGLFSSGPPTTYTE